MKNKITTEPRNKWISTEEDKTFWIYNKNLSKTEDSITIHKESWLEKVKSEIEKVNKV